MPASLVLHLLVIAFLLFELPISLPQPQQEETISVDLVPPPEAPEEAKAEPPPAPEPEAEKPPEPEPEPQTPPPASSAEQQPLPSLRPVFQFGERDAGPRESLEGNSAQDGSGPPVPEPEEAELAEGPPDQPVEASEKPAETPETPVKAEEQAAQPEEAETAASESAGATANESGDDGSASLDVLHDPQLDPAAQLPAPTDNEEIDVALPKEAERPMPRPANPAAPRGGSKLQEAERLFSQSTIPARIATTAMGGLPREVRGTQLCVTELREQLRNASPPYFPDLLPSYPLGPGTVLDVSEAAFRVSGQWFNLSFRCTVDKDATKVVSFAFHVGEPIPRSQWARRELPSQ